MARQQTHIHLVHIADGFADDCEELIHRCSRMETLTYPTFCEIWKDMNFSSLYQGRTSSVEIAELSEELIHIAKHFMIADTSNFEETVAGVFLVYALLNLQPFPSFAALRLVPEDVEQISRIEFVSRRDRRLDVLYVLGAILVKGPCQYHAVERERGLEISLRKYLSGFGSIDKMGVRPKGVFYRQNVELDIIRDLSNLLKIYSEAKTDICQVEDRNLAYIDVNMATDLYTSLKKIVNGEINEDKVVEEPQPGSSMSARAIKDKAMKTSVDPMKHLTGVKERKAAARSPKKVTEIKSKPGKVKTGSPKKPVITSSPKKRKTTPKKLPNTKKRKQQPKYVSESDSDCDDDVSSLASDDDLTPDDEEDLNLDAFIKQSEINTEAEAENVTIESENAIEVEREIDIDVASLPVLIRTQNEGIEIEIIDHYKEDQPKLKTYPKKKNMRAKLMSLPDISIEKVTTKVGESSKNILPTDMATISKRISDTSVLQIPVDSKLPKLRKKERREQKKVTMRSKFKRLGILPMGNFKE